MAEPYAWMAFEYLKEKFDEPLSQSELKVQLEKIRKGAFALGEALRQARGLTVDLLNSRRPVNVNEERRLATLAELQKDLEWLAQAAACPYTEATTKLPSVKKHKGPQRKETLRRIADQAANDFFTITGKRPSRSHNRGEFGAFLADLFVALEITENSLSYEQEATKKWDKEQKEQEEREKLNNATSM